MDLNRAQVNDGNQKKDEHNQTGATLISSSN
jgi:hypothetical protein